MVFWFSSLGFQTSNNNLSDLKGPKMKNCFFFVYIHTKSLHLNILLYPWLIYGGRESGIIKCKGNRSRTGQVFRKNHFYNTVYI